MDTPTTTSPSKGTAPKLAPAAKGGIVGARPRPAMPRHLIWLSAFVLVAHLSALAWWLAPSHPEASPLNPAFMTTGIARVTTANTSPLALASQPAPTASATLVSPVDLTTPSAPTARTLTVGTNPAQALPQPTGEPGQSGHPGDSKATPTQTATHANTPQSVQAAATPKPAPPHLHAKATEKINQYTPPSLTNKQQFATHSSNATAPTPGALANTRPAQPMAEFVPVVLHSGSTSPYPVAAAAQKKPSAPEAQASPAAPQAPDGPYTPPAQLATPAPPSLPKTAAPGASQTAMDDTADGSVQVAAATKARQASKGTESTTAKAAADTVAGPLRVPPSATLAFQVTAKRKGLELPARSTLRWEVNGSTYSASLVIEMAFVRNRSQTSVGSIDPVLGLQPRRFGDKNRTEVATHFDRSRTPPVIRFSANAPSVPLQAQSQDRLSVLFQLAAQVAGAPAHFKEGQRANIHTAGSRDAELWVFRVVGTDHLTLPAGPMDTVHLVREAASAYDNRVDVWLAPALDHLPVRILWTQSNGDVVEQALSEHTP